MAVRVYEGFDRLPAALADILSARSGVPFFRSMEWFRCLADHGIEQAKPRIYVTGDTALFCNSVGRKLHSLGNFYTISFGPTGNPDGLAEIMAFIVAEPQRWSLAEFRNLEQDACDALELAASSAGFITYPWAQHRNWRLEVAGRSFETYYNDLDSRLRNTIERRERKGAREHELRFAIYPQDDVGLDNAIEHYDAVYAASWKEPEPFPDFMSNLMRCAAKLGIARIGLAWVDGAPAAAQLWLNENEVSFIYKLAYREEFRDLSIGTLLSKRMFQHAIDVDNVTTIDYGTGDEAYKKDWMSESRLLSGLLCCNRNTVSGWLRSLREKLATARRN